MDNIPVRLAGGSDTDGRVEVFYSGIWGTVCNMNNSWSVQDANVACRQLGLGPLIKMTLAVDYQPASGVIMTDGFGCHGTESFLAECLNVSWGNTGCKHGDDVGIKCSGKIVFKAI